MYLVTAEMIMFKLVKAESLYRLTQFEEALKLFHVGARYYLFCATLALVIFKYFLPGGVGVVATPSNSLQPLLNFPQNCVVIRSAVINWLIFIIEGVKLRCTYQKGVKNSRKFERGYFRNSLTCFC